MPEEFDFRFDSNEEALINQMRVSSHTLAVGNCPHCKNKGYTLDENKKAQLCECVKHQMWLQKLDEAGVPKRLIGKTIDDDWNINQDAFGNDLGADREKKIAVKEFMKKYIKAIPALCAGMMMTFKSKKRSNFKSNSLVLVGGASSGKSLLAAIAVQETLQQGFSAKIYTWTDLLNILKDYEYKDEQDVIASEFGHIDLVVIDGVCDYKSKSYNFMFQLDRISRIRERASKPVIITCEPSYESIVSGSGWMNLLASCYKVVLPTPHVIKEVAKQEIVQHKNVRNKVVKPEETSNEE